MTDPLAPGTTPKARDYFDSDGQLLVSFDWTPAKKKDGNGGLTYYIKTTNKTTGRSSRGLYVKFENVALTFPIASEYPTNDPDKPNRSCKLSFSIDKDHKFVPLLTEVIENGLKKVAMDATAGGAVSASLNQKANVWLKRKLSSGDDNSHWMEVPTNLHSPIKELDSILASGEIPFEYQVKGLNLPLKFNKDGENWAKDERLIINSGPGYRQVKIVDYNAYFEHALCQKRLSNAIEKHIDTEFYEEKVRDAKTIYNESCKIVYTFFNISKHIPRGTKFRYVGVKINGLYMNQAMIVVKGVVSDLWYTNEIEGSANIDIADDIEDALNEELKDHEVEEEY